MSYKCYYWYDRETEADKRFPDGYPEQSDEKFMARTRMASGGDSMVSGVHYNYATLTTKPDGAFIVRSLRYQRAADPNGAGNYDPDITTVTNEKQFTDVEAAFNALNEFDSVFANSNAINDEITVRAAKYAAQSNGDNTFGAKISRTFGLRSSDSFVDIVKATLESGTLPHRPETNEVPYINPVTTTHVKYPDGIHNTAEHYERAKREISGENSLG